MCLVEKKHTTKLQDDLALHTRMGDRKKLSLSIREAKYLSCIPLEPISSKKVRTAEKEASSESVIINGVRTFGGSTYYGCIRMLEDVCYQLCQINELSLDPGVVHDSIILRMSRNIAGGDAYLKLKSTVRASNLLLVRTDHDSSNLPPIEVDLFVSSGNLHGVISTMSTFGLVRKGDLNGKGEVSPEGYLNLKKQGKSVKSWVNLLVTVTERINFSNDSSIRFADIKVDEREQS